MSSKILTIKPREQEAEEHKVIKEENRRLVAKLDRFENQPSRQPAIASINRMPSAIQPTTTPLRPIYDMTSRNFSPTKSSTINDREPVINSSFKGTKFSKQNITYKKTSSVTRVRPLFPVKSSILTILKQFFHAK